MGEESSTLESKGLSSRSTSSARSLTTRLAVLLPSVSIISMTRATMTGPYLSTNLGHCVCVVCLGAESE